MLLMEFQFGIQQHFYLQIHHKRTQLVKAKFLKLNSSHLEYVIGCMRKNTAKIANIKAYMITALYNAPNTINHYYQQEVQHDMYGGGCYETNDM